MASRHPVTIGSLKVPYPIKADNLQVFHLCSATHAASPNILDEGFENVRPIWDSHPCLGTPAPYPREARRMDRWSGGRDSNPQRSVWKTETLPLSYPCTIRLLGQIPLDC